MANKYLKTFSTSLAIPELRINSSLRFQLILNMMAIANKRGDRKNIQARGCGRGLGEAEFYTWPGFCTHQLTAAVITREDLQKIKLIKIPHGWGGVPGDPTLGGGSEWLVATWWGRVTLLWGYAALIGLRGFLTIIKKKGQEVGRQTRWKQ